MIIIYSFLVKRSAQVQYTTIQLQYKNFSCIDLVLNINIFKNRLDKFWSSYDFVYLFRAQPLDTGSVK